MAGIHGDFSRYLDMMYSPLLKQNFDKIPVPKEYLDQLLGKPGFIISTSRLNLECKFAGEYLVSERSFDFSVKFQAQLPFNMDDLKNNVMKPVEYIPQGLILEEHLHEYLPDISSVTFDWEGFDERDIDPTSGLATIPVNFFIYYPLRHEPGLYLFLDFETHVFYQEERDGKFDFYTKYLEYESHLSDCSCIKIDFEDENELSGRYYQDSEPSETPCLDSIYLPILNNGKCRITHC